MLQTLSTQKSKYAPLFRHLIFVKDYRRFIEFRITDIVFKLFENQPSTGRLDHVCQISQMASVLSYQTTVVVWQRLDRTLIRTTIAPENYDEEEE